MGGSKRSLWGLGTHSLEIGSPRCFPLHQTMGPTDENLVERTVGPTQPGYGFKGKSDKLSTKCWLLET